MLLPYWDYSKRSHLPDFDEFRDSNPVLTTCSCGKWIDHSAHTFYRVSHGLEADRTEYVGWPAVPRICVSGSPVHATMPSIFTLG